MAELGLNDGDLGVDDIISTGVDTEVFDNINQYNTRTMNYKSDDYLKIFSTNIRSCRRNFAHLQAFLNCLNIAFHCIVLSEIWLTDDTITPSISRAIIPFQPLGIISAVGSRYTLVTIFSQRK